LAKERILIVDDEKNIAASLEGILSDEGYETTTIGDGLDALEIIHLDPPDLIILDIWLPGIDGIEVLKTVRTYHPEIKVLIMSGHGTIDTAVQATKLGANDFIEKPFSIDQLVQSIEQALKQNNTRGFTRRTDGIRKSDIPLCFDLMVGVRKAVKKGMENSKPALILGEPGTGKEIIARAIHRGSKEAIHPFLKINCSVRSTTSIEEELFGSAQKSDKDNSPQKREKKTLYLKNIDALDNSLQVKLAQSLNNNQSNAKSSLLPARLFISSSNSLEKLVKKNQFNSDLFAAIKEQTIPIPPLREFSANISAIAKNYLKEFSEDEELAKNLSPEVTNALCHYDWPENMKELKSVLDKLIREVPSKDKVTLNHLPFNIRESEEKIDPKVLQGDTNLAEEREFIVNELRQNDWVIENTLVSLKMDKKTFLKKLDKLNIDLPDSKEPKSNGDRQHQRTLKRSVVLCGQGLHSGIKTGLILQPLPPGSGIIFGDISTGSSTPAQLSSVHSTEYSTSLKSGFGSIATIEHIMAVLHMYRITNLLIKIGDEVPVMDGSAKDFCELIEDGEFEDQDENYDEIIIDKHYSVGNKDDGGAYISIEPNDNFVVSYHMDYPLPIGIMDYTFEFNGQESFKKEIAPARTFGFVKDVAALTKMGFASGGKLDNFILLGDNEVVNTELRFNDEFVRHKILDIIGDFYLLGKPLRGHIKAHKSGHTQNIGLLRKVENDLVMATS
jgi:UDP-3-O-acyl N-acetylglucosamine deacetylase